MFNKAKYDEAIVRSGYTRKHIAASLGFDYCNFAKKSQGVVDWKVNEVIRFQDFMNLPDDERDAIFFAKDRTKCEEEETK